MFRNSITLTESNVVGLFKILLVMYYRVIGIQFLPIKIFSTRLVSGWYIIKYKTFWTEPSHEGMIPVLVFYVGSLWSVCNTAYFLFSTFLPLLGRKKRKSPVVWWIISSVREAWSMDQVQNSCVTRKTIYITKRPFLRDFRKRCLKRTLCEIIIIATFRSRFV